MHIIEGPETEEKGAENILEKLGENVFNLMENMKYTYSRTSMKYK